MQSLNVPAERLMERFVRGEESRSTEGSGLGLSIARSLTLPLGQGLIDELRHANFLPAHRQHPRGRLGGLHQVLRQLLQPLRFPVQHLNILHRLGIRLFGLLFLSWWAYGYHRLRQGTKTIARGDLEYQIDTKRMPYDLRLQAEDLNNISVGLSGAVEEKTGPPVPFPAPGPGTPGCPP